MTKAFSDRLRVSASKVRGFTSKGTKQIKGVFSKKSKKLPIAKSQISAPVPGSFVHLLHIPARPAGFEGDPLVPNDPFVIDVFVDDTPTSNEELQNCRRKLRQAKSDLAWLRTATAGLLKLEVQRSADLAATNRELRQELMESKTTRNAVRSKSRRRLIDEVAHLRARLDRAADEIKRLRQMLDNVREMRDYFARAGGFIA